VAGEARSERTLTAIHEAGCFGISHRGEQHRAVASLFDTKVTNKFNGEWTVLLPHGSPVLPNALSMESAVHRTFPVGDHEVVIGAVEMVRIGEGAPLVHHERTMSFSPTVTLAAPWSRSTRLRCATLRREARQGRWTIVSSVAAA
jgi:flavin reductase (DIM6/NTAB) family NADH-FMN oxidoreductase RutF